MASMWIELANTLWRSLYVTNFLVLKKQFNGLTQKDWREHCEYDRALYVLIFKKIFNWILSNSFSYLSTLDLESLFNEREICCFVSEKCVCFQCFTQSFSGIPGHISTVYLRETEGPCQIFFRIYSIEIGLKCTPRLDLRSFYKFCSKQIGLNIWVPIPIQWYKNICGRNTGFRDCTFYFLLYRDSFIKVCLEFSLVLHLLSVS